MRQMRVLRRRHDVRRTLMRMDVTGRLVETGKKYTLNRSFPFDVLTDVEL